MKRHLIVLFLLLGIATALRFYQLGQIPEGFHADEAAYGYNAYSVLKTTRDEYGRFMPMIFESFGDYKAGVYSYLSIPFIAIFGLNEFAVRFPSAIFGVLFVILSYAIVMKLSKNKELALIVVGVATFSPLGILLSRVQSDPLICVVFFFLAFYCWLVWVETKKIQFLVCLLCSMVVSFFTYTLTRLFAIPFFLLIGAFYWRTYTESAKRTFSVILGVIFLVITLLSVTSAGTRLSQIHIFSKQDVQLLLDEAIREDGVGNVSGLGTRIIHNKVVAYARYMLINYSEYVSPQFLFFQAEQPLREQIPGMGVIFIIELPLLLIGVYQSVRRRLSYGIISTLWILLVPAILSVVSGETPNIHRFFLAALPLHVLVGIGILFLYKTIFPKNIVIVGITVLALYILSTAYFFHQLFVHQPTHFPYYRGYAYKQLVNELPKYYTKYNKIVITKANESPYIYILFFGAYNPKQYQLSGSHRDLDYQGFDKYVFVPYDCPSFNESPLRGKMIYDSSMLLVQRGGCALGKNDKLLDVVYWAEGTKAFQFVEYQSDN